MQLLPGWVLLSFFPFLLFLKINLSINFDPGLRDAVLSHALLSPDPRPSLLRPLTAGLHSGCPSRRLEDAAAQEAVNLQPASSVTRPRKSILQPSVSHNVCCI